MEPRSPPEERERLEVYESRILLGLWSVGFIVLFLGGVLMVGSTLGLLLGLLGPTRSGDFPFVVGAMLLGLVGIVLCGSASVQMARRLFSAPTPVVFVAGDGFKDIRISAEWIPWSTISSLTDPYGGKGSRGFLIAVKPGYAPKLRLSFVSRFTQLGNRLLGHNGLWVVTVTLRKLPAGTLFETIRQRMNRGSAAPRAASAE
jgi:hypothetical protein